MIASDTLVCKDLPNFNNCLAINKSTISDYDIFKEYVELSGLSVRSDENDYVIVEGPIEEVKLFKKYWNVMLSEER